MLVWYVMIDCLKHFISLFLFFNAKRTTMKFSFTLLLVTLSLFGFGQSGSFVLGIPGPCGGCAAACVTAGVCSPQGNGNCSPAQTVSQIVTVPANSNLELTVTTVACNSGTDGLDSGDNFFVNGELIVTGSGNTPVAYSGCFSSSATPLDVPIELTANRRDETVLVEWEVFPGAGAGCALLPIELVGFTALAKTQSVQLDWATALELNNSHFEVQHSINGSDFIIVGEVDGFGNSTEMQEYHFMHEDFLSGRNYYRLRQVDLDGNFSYSSIVVVRSKGNNPISIRPTLVRDYIRLSFENNVPSQVAIQILDVRGQEIMKELITSDDLQTEIHVTDLQAGIYIMRYNINGVISTQRFVKL